MAKDDIRLSEKHGVNPSLGICFYCGREDGTIALLGKLPGDKEAPRAAVYSLEPCAECAELMNQGVILIETLDGESGNNPQRTGNQWVVKEDALREMMNPGELLDKILDKRFSFIEASTARKVGLEPPNGGHRCNGRVIAVRGKHMHPSADCGSAHSTIGLRRLGWRRKRAEAKIDP